MSKPLPALQHWADKRYGLLLSFLQSQLGEADPIVWDSINREIERQISNIILIASESMASPAVMAAYASPGYVQTVEGRPGRRWYPSVEGVDALELAAEGRAKSLFGFPEANVQLHSATQANQAIYLSILQHGNDLEPGDTILSPSFVGGGHLSHGVAASLAGRLYNVQFYGPRAFEEEISVEDIELLIRRARPRPKLIVAGCSAYPREVPYDAIIKLAKQYEIPVLADISHTAGFVAARIHAPVASADFCTMSLHKTMCGPRAGVVLTQSKYRERVEKAVFPGLQGAIFPNVLAAKAVCLNEAASERFTRLQQGIVKNAQAMAKVFLAENLSLYTGGTETQLILIKSSASGDGKMDVQRLQQIGILANANYIHGDTLGKTKASGIRLGTTWITQLGFKERHAAMLAGIVAETIKVRSASLEGLRSRLNELVDDVLGSAAQEAGSALSL